MTTIHDIYDGFAFNGKDMMIIKAALMAVRNEARNNPYKRMRLGGDDYLDGICDTLDKVDNIIKLANKAQKEQVADETA